MNSSRLVATAVLLGAMGTSAVASAGVGRVVGRFTSKGSATTTPIKYVTTHYHQYMGPGGHDQCVYGAARGTWDPYTYYCDWDQVIRYSGYMSAASGTMMVNDLLFWMKAPGAVSFTQLLFPPKTDDEKIHTGICSSVDSLGRCNWLWNNTAVFAMPSISSCQEIQDWNNVLVNKVMALPPGILTSEPSSAQETKGNLYFFRPSSAASTTATYNRGLAANKGIGIGGTQVYNIGGTTVYSSKSVCSEAAGSMYGLQLSEGLRYTTGFASGYPADPAVTGEKLAGTGYKEAFNICRYGASSTGQTLPGWFGISNVDSNNMFGFGAGACVSQGGRDGICDDMADSIANGLLNRADMGDNDFPPAIHAIGTPNVPGTGVTMTPFWFYILY